MPRQIQLKNMVLEAEASEGSLANEETGISRHLQNEKVAINQQIDKLDHELRKKQEELNEQISLTQTQGLENASGIKTQDLLPDSQFDEGGRLGHTQKELLQDLRQKTQAVEELSMKIDELYQINSSLENLMVKVQRYNSDLFKSTQAKMSSKELSQSDLRKLIGDQNKKLETFPRQNKNCIEYYEKYRLKYEELDSKFGSQKKTEKQISELLLALKEKKAKSIEQNFRLMSKNFSTIFQSIVKEGSAQLKLVKLQHDASQQSEPTQFPDVG